MAVAGKLLTLVHYGLHDGHIHAVARASAAQADAAQADAAQADAAQAGPDGIGCETVPQA